MSFLHTKKNYIVKECFVYTSQPKHVNHTELLLPTRFSPACAVRGVEVALSAAAHAEEDNMLSKTLYLPEHHRHSPSEFHHAN